MSLFGGVSGGGGVPVVLPQTLLVKATDEGRWTGTYIDDTDFQCALDADSLYRIDVFLQFSLWLHGYRVRMVVSPDATSDYTKDPSDAMAIPGLIVTSTGTNGITYGVADNNGSPATLTRMGFFTTGSVPGNFSMQWGSYSVGTNASNQASLLRAGSHVILTKLAG